MQRAFNGPSEMPNSSADATGWNIGAPRPLAKRERFITVGDQVITAPISRLRRDVGPSAIAWFVITFVVDAVHAVFVAGPWTDVAKERGEIMEPFRGYRDSASAVIDIPAIVGVIAAVFHAAPRSVFGCRSTGSSCVPVGQSPRANQVIFVAAARLYCATPQVAQSSSDLFAAIARTAHHAFAALGSLGQSFGDDKARKPLANLSIRSGFAWHDSSDFIRSAA